MKHFGLLTLLALLHAWGLGSCLQFGNRFKKPHRLPVVSLPTGLGSFPGILTPWKGPGFGLPSLPLLHSFTGLPPWVLVRMS